MTRNGKTVDGEDDVCLGSRVTIQNVDSAEKADYELVLPNEVDRSRNRISVYCPLADAIIGCGAGEAALVRLPEGTKGFKILEIVPPES
ncbi:MAG: GreA/GreB family elongation factor [Elusimicrobiota bacterium]